ncbi:MAG: GNAT family N-acetyltransferase [Bacteroidales bacterium]|nr:GNAT family N-acetyltransferase [Bacteroidales bacterium]
MRKQNQEITDKNIIEEILSFSAICRIAMMDDDVPYLLPFNYGYHDNCIYIHSAPEGKKIDLIRKNNRVCFEIEQTARIIKSEKACKWATLYRSVVGYGNVEIISEFNEKQKGLEIIMAHNGAIENMEFERKQIEAVVLLKLKIDKITGKQSGNWNKYENATDYSVETERLFLKEITWGDLENIYRLHTLPETDEYNTLGILKNTEEARNVMQPAIEDKFNDVRKKILWTVTRKDTGAFIGEAGMSLSADRFKLGEIFYNILPEQWNKGYGTETARALIRFGFEKLHLHKIEAGVATENVRSIRVLEKAGMQREGLRRKILPIRGVWKDNYHYAIVEDDPVRY